MYAYRPSVYIVYYVSTCATPTCRPKPTWIYVHDLNHFGPLFHGLDLSMSIYLNRPLSIYFYNMSMSIYLSIYLSICLSVYLAIHQPSPILIMQLFLTLSNFFYVFLMSACQMWSYHSLPQQQTETGRKSSSVQTVSRLKNPKSVGTTSLA